MKHKYTRIVIEATAPGSTTMTATTSTELINDADLKPVPRRKNTMLGEKAGCAALIHTVVAMAYGVFVFAIRAGISPGCIDWVSSISMGVLSCSGACLIGMSAARIDIKMEKRDGQG